MAENIKKELSEIQEGTYGLDIRMPIHDAIEKLYRHKGTPYTIHNPITQFEYDLIEEPDNSVAYPILNPYSIFVGVVSADTGNVTYEAFGKLYETKNYITEAEGEIDLIIGESVPNVSFSTGDFANITKLRSIIISAPLVGIGQSVFAGCSNVEKFLMADQTTVTYLPTNFVAGLLKLESFSIPSGITFIDNNCFVGCTGLRTVDVPSSVTYISSQSFTGCHDVVFNIDAVEGGISGFPWGATNSTVNWNG